MISDAKAPAETLSVAEVAETVEYESVAPVFVLALCDLGLANFVMYLIDDTGKAVFHVQSQRF
jgi:hypothetical protein